MTAALFLGDAEPKEERWHRMMVLSLLFHLAILCTTLFVVPKSSLRYPSLEGNVYNVELVGSPARGTSVGKAGRAFTSNKRQTSTASKAKTRRIFVGKKKSPPILAKRVSPKAISKKRDKAPSASKLVDRAISKIEQSVKEDKAAHLDRAISKIEQKLAEKKENQPQQGQEEVGGDVSAVLGGTRAGIPGMPSGVGAGIQLYQMEIETAIKNNWSYPVALSHSRKGDIPEALVILTLRKDGKILKTWFKSRSSNPLFDDSVMKAIEKSDPLPAFPPGYRKSYEEVEINFSLKDFV